MQCSAHWEGFIASLTETTPPSISLALLINFNKRVRKRIILQLAVVAYDDLSDINEMTTTDKLLLLTKQTLKLTTLTVYSLACYPLQLHKALNSTVT